jgi:hypothetical protein
MQLMRGISSGIRLILAHCHRMPRDWRLSTDCGQAKPLLTVHMHLIAQRPIYQLVGDGS